MRKSYVSIIVCGVVSFQAAVGEEIQCAGDGNQMSPLLFKPRADLVSGLKSDDDIILNTLMIDPRANANSVIESFLADTGSSDASKGDLLLVETTLTNSVKKNRLAQEREWLRLAESLLAGSFADEQHGLQSIWICSRILDHPFEGHSDLLDVLDIRLALAKKNYAMYIHKQPDAQYKNLLSMLSCDKKHFEDCYSQSFISLLSDLRYYCALQAHLGVYEVSEINEYWRKMYERIALRQIELENRAHFSKIIEKEGSDVGYFKKGVSR